MPKIEDIRARLLALKAELQALDEATADNRKPVELDQQSVGRLSRMDAMQVQAMAEATEAKRHLQVRRIDAALKRVEDDDYGFCVTCGEEIQAKRLDLDPTTPTCIECANNG